MLLEHNLIRPDGLIECDSVLDIGAGIRPMNWYAPHNHTCVEPYEPYAKILKQHGYATWVGTALDILSYDWPEAAKFEAIYLLDVIEHMEKEQGLEVIEKAELQSTKQIVIYTPTGFMAQEGDSWGLGGDEWQKHRSGWLPEEFPGWDIQFHGKSFFAVLTK